MPLHMKILALTERKLVRAQQDGKFVGNFLYKYSRPSISSRYPEKIFKSHDPLTYESQITKIRSTYKRVMS